MLPFFFFLPGGGRVCHHPAFDWLLQERTDGFFLGGVDSDVIRLWDGLSKGLARFFIF